MIILAKWWVIISIAIILSIDIALFYFIPNGGLITFATLPYMVWWAGWSRKTHYLLIPLMFIVVVFLCFILPILAQTAAVDDIAFFGNVYAIIFPQEFSYSWQQQPPVSFGWTIGAAVSVILWCKLFLWLCKKFYKKISKKNFMLALSCGLISIMFFYMIVNMIPALLGGDVFNSFRSFFGFSLFYDICFVWTPFVTIYFVFDYIASEITNSTL